MGRQAPKGPRAGSSEKRNQVPCRFFLEQIWNVLLLDVRTLGLRPVTYADQLLSNIDLTEACIA